MLAFQAFPTFLAEVWEKQPKVYKANDSKKEYFDELCSLEQLYNILDGRLPVTGLTQTSPSNGCMLQEM